MEIGNAFYYHYPLLKKSENILIRFSKIFYIFKKEGDKLYLQ